MRSVLRSLLRLLPALGLLLATIPAAARSQQTAGASFSAGSVVVYRVGDGAAALSPNGNPVFLDEFNPATGALLQSIPMPTTPNGSSRAFFATTSAREGLLTRASDGRSLILTGFSNAIIGLPGAATFIPRVIARVEADGAINTATGLTDYASLELPTSAASPNGLQFWAAGGAGGLRFASASGVTSTQIVATPISMRQVAIFNGQLYATTADTGVNVRLGSVGTGLPLSGGQSLTPLPGLPTTGSPFGFFFADLSATVAGLDTLYIAFEDLGIAKYCLVGDSWVARGVIGADADDYRGLTGTVDQSRVTLYATRTASELVRLIDGGGYNEPISGVPALLATAGANTAFRGVALAPRAASAPLPDLTVSVRGPATAQVGQAISYAISVRNSGVTGATGVTVRFSLPAGVSFIAAEGDGFTASASEGVVTFTGGSVGVDSQADLLVSVDSPAVGPITLPQGAAVVDPDGAIDELDESNNASLQQVVTVILPEGGSGEDTTPPSTTITGSPPLTTTATATFSFTGADETTPTEVLIFQCSLDEGPFTPCSSPVSYTNLAPGSYRFEVRAIDAAGNVDPTPATHSWSVVLRTLLPLIAQ